MRRQTHWIFWIFIIFWRLICGLVGLIGRLLSVVLGAVLIIVGIVLCFTIIGSIIGIPMILIGGMMILCALFRRRRRR